MGEVLQSAINVSTASSAVLEEMVARLRSISGLCVADWSSDVDHNRSVITLLGSRSTLREAVHAIFAVARERLDIRCHRGEHPRIGIVDVVPFTPWKGVTMDDCRVFTWEVGEEIAERFQVPVYFYGEAAKRPERRDLAFIRRGGYEALKEEIATVPERFPDAGPPLVHPTLGATAFGARDVLIAFNVNLKTTDVALARRIAARIRGGLQGAKAIGVQLRTRDMVQVAVNVVDFRKNTLLEIFELVKLEAQRFGVPVAGAEIVGLVPLEALVDLAGNVLGIPDFRMEQVVEYHLSHFDFF